MAVGGEINALLATGQIVLFPGKKLPHNHLIQFRHIGHMHVISARFAGANHFDLLRFERRADHARDLDRLLVVVAGADAVDKGGT